MRLFALLCLMLACSSSRRGAEPDPTSMMTPDAGSDREAPPDIMPSNDAEPPLESDAGASPIEPPETPLETCSASASVATDITETIDMDGEPRTFHIHAPAGYDPAERTPVVFNFHGLRFTGMLQEATSHMNAAADAHGFIAVHPDGIGNSWNAGSCCGTAMTSESPDVLFVDAIVEHIRSHYCVDDQRIYATGMSNGGHMSHRLACERSDTFAAAASVTGTLKLTDCQPSRPVPILDIHGTGDFVVDYSEAETSITRWRDLNECDEGESTVHDQGDTTCDQWSCADSTEVIFCTVTNGGHQWPGGNAIPFLGHATSDIIATEAIWDFFMRHPMP